MRKKMDPWLVAVLYAGLGLAWLLVSSFLKEGWDLGAMLRAPGPQTHKALGYILFTAALIYLLVRMSRASIQRERAWYRELFENNPHPMWVYDLHTLRFLAVNHAAIDHYGYSREEFLRMTLADIRPREDVPALRENIAAVREGLDRAGVWRHLRKDGSLIRVEIASHTVAFEGRRAEMVLAQDVTARLQAEEALRQSQSLLRMSSRLSRIGGWSVSVARGVHEMTWSEEVRAIHEAPADFRPDLKSAVRFYPPEHRETILRAVRHCIRHGIHFDEEVQIITARGRRVWVRVIGEAVFASDGHVAQVQGAMQDVTERKEALFSLLRSERRFFNLADAMPFIVWTAEPNGNIDFANQAFTEYSGVPVDENLASRTTGLMHPADAEGGLAAWAKAVQEGQPYQVELRLRRASDGSYRWHQVRGLPIRDERGTLTKWYGTAIDVNKIKIAEERFRLVTRVTNDLIWDVDTVRETIWWGEGFEALFGEAPPPDSRTPVKFWEDRLHPEDRARVLARVDESFNGAGDVWSDEYRLRRANGEYVTVFDRGHVSRDSLGCAVRLIGGMTDLTERKRAEEDLRRLSRQLEEERARLLEAQSVAKVGSWEFDLATGASTWSEETYRIFETDPFAFRPTMTGIAAFVHPDDREDFIRAFEESLVSGDTGALVHRIVLPDGRIKHLEEVWRMDRAAGRAIGTCQDITGRVALEEQYRKAQKMEAVGRLAGGIAHDFNNMLTVILMRSELALARAGENEALRGMLKEIHDAAERSAGLTRQLLIYARRQKSELQVLDLNAAVENSLKILRRLIGEDIDLEWRPGAGLWMANLDPAQVDQVLANLCVNARDAIATTGKVVIETGNVSFARETPSGKKGDYLLLSVSDNGSGMDAEILAHLFEPFYTTKEVGKGTGLGLAIVYGIVQQAGGFIEVDSAPGSGTTFRLYLPRHRAPAAPAPAPAPAEPPRGRGETLLIVEDEPMILKAAVEILEEQGYGVLAADRPAEALELVREHGARIRLLVTDVIMPAMNGRELAERSCALHPELRVLFISGYTSDVMQGRGLLGADAPFVKKPFTPAELARRVREALDGPRIPMGTP